MGALLERDREQEAVTCLFDAAAAGRGGVVVLHGPGGIGKTGIAEVAVAAARARGFLVGRARGGSLEQDFPFGAARQLLEPLVATATDRAQLFDGVAAVAAPIVGGPGDATTDGTGAVLHGLYWVTAALADARPLTLVLDDVHWFDPPSLRYLGYLLHRVDELPIAVVVATRPPEPGPAGELLARILAEHHAAVLDLAPLTGDAVSRLVRTELDPEADDGFCRAVADLTRGNPFLVHELVRSVHAAGLAPATATPIQVGEVAASSAILGRLGRLPNTALELARSAAVLGVDAHLRHAAALAGLGMEEAATAADVLLQAQILGPERPLTFVHPLVASAVYNAVLPGDRAMRHRRAATLLHDEGVPIDRVATHLLAAEPAGDPWVTSILVGAARRASATGATDVSITYLRRALAEPPAAADRPAIALELGAAEALISDPGCIDRLREVLPSVDDPDLRLMLATIRGLTLSLLHGREKEAVAAVGEVVPVGLANDGTDWPLDHLAAAVLVGMTGPATAPLVAAERAVLRDRVDPAGDAPAAVLAVRSFVGALAGEPIGPLADTAERALATLSPDDLVLPLWYHLPVTVLVMADRNDAADAAIELGLAIARRLGAPSHLGVTLFLRAWRSLRDGELADAEDDARAALELQQLHGNDVLVPGPLSILVEVHRERGRLAEADELLDRFLLSDGDGDSLFHLFLLRARARLRGAQGRWTDRARDGRRGLERYAAIGGTAPAFLPFDADLALGYLASGDLPAARAHAREALDRAEASGAPRALGEALRVVALVEGHDHAGLLDRSLALLQQAGAKLEEAWTLYAQGAALRRWGDTAAARAAEERCLQLADRCGSELLAQMAKAELVALGARPRRTQLVGVGALTPSERRVVDLVAAGHTNKQVAQALFVTVKTVETHLAHAYQKLQIGSRAELAAALAAG